MNTYYKDKNVLVIGASGFIGSRLVEKLTLEENANVTGIVHHWNRATWVSRTTAQLFQGDITEKESIEKYFNNIEIVFHLSAIGGSKENCYMVNVQGTKNIIDLCIQYKVKRLVFFSTVGVHGPYITDSLSEESSFKDFGYHYANSKIECEMFFYNLPTDISLEWTILRPTYVWGFYSQWFTITPIRQMKKNQFFLVDNGEGKYNGVFVDNVVHICLIAGYHKNAVRQVFLVTDNEKITWKDFWEYYANIIGKKINKMPNWSSKKERGVVIRISEKGLNLIINTASKIINRYKSVHLINIPFRVIRKISLVLVKRITTPYNKWDLLKFSSPGYIDIHKSINLLGYIPVKTIEKGMIETENWLRCNGYIE